MDKKQFSQADAQYRVDQIHAFQKEISELENDDVLVMPVEQAQAVNAYHSKLLQTLTTTYCHCLVPSGPGHLAPSGPFRI